MNEIIVTIPGRPIPLKRPRMSKRRVYDQQASIKEDLFWYIKSQTMAYPLLNQFSGPLTIDLEFNMPIPKSISKRKQHKLINQPHHKRPDIDNLVKFYLDVCNALLYKDDAQIYTVNATKKYSQQPSTVIKVRQEVDNG